MTSSQQAVKYELPKLEADEKKCFEVIEKHIRAKGIAPSIPETAKALGKPKSFSTVQRLRKQLREKGYITWQDGIYRSLQIVMRPPQMRALIGATQELLKASTNHRASVRRSKRK